MHVFTAQSPQYLGGLLGFVRRPLATWSPLAITRVNPELFCSSSDSTAWLLNPVLRVIASNTSSVALTYSQAVCFSAQLIIILLIADFPGNTRAIIADALALNGQHTLIASSSAYLGYRVSFRFRLFGASAFYGLLLILRRDGLRSPQSCFRPRRVSPRSSHALLSWVLSAA